MAEEKRVYYLDRKNKKIVWYPVLRDCNTRWFVGEMYVPGGYIAKGKKYTDNFDKVCGYFRLLLAEEIKEAERKLLNMKLSHDALEESNFVLLEQMKVIKRANKFVVMFNPLNVVEE